ncbi:MAG: NAD-dependent epimerase/dehydratase family protein [Sphingobacteriales bacterium]|nr:MAG: NAD-dependent epimerase/dehydratase family protein [Sphingobacteriales bacterium]
MANEQELAIWGGIECTINRVGDQYLDQLEYSGHYGRGSSDIDLVASLGIRRLRYPVLWEKHLPQADSTPDWTFAASMLDHMRGLGIEPIAGLVHHGSGPAYVNFFDGSFEEGLAAYAEQVALRFPWIRYYTPVNEPLTTARFCGMYGHWYPHGRDTLTFFRILLSECKATVLAMEAIRRINPEAELVQTEDLGKCHSTPLLQYQADFENERRWLSYDLLCGALTPDKLLYRYMRKTGIAEEDLQWFLAHPCPPAIAGFNYYLTSERYLDEELQHYPEVFHGGNGKHRYADIHTVHAAVAQEKCGPYHLLKEAWERLGLPMAITECHLHSTREDQVRWFHSMWEAVQRVRSEGVDIRAITAWALFGLHGWNRLVTEPWGDYEPGVFNLQSGTARPTALAAYIRERTGAQSCAHPILARDGWWSRKDRLVYGARKVVSINRNRRQPACRPVLILGRNGTLGRAFARVCAERNIHYQLTGRNELDLSNGRSMEEALELFDPWCVINAAGYVDVDAAERDAERCLQANAYGPVQLAGYCAARGIRFVGFSSDLVFDGSKTTPYTESDAPAPLNVYGRSKALLEAGVATVNADALLLRTSAFFGAWDEYNFLYKTWQDLREGRVVQAAADAFVSPTHVPELVHTALDLLLDGEQGLWHVANNGVLSWAEFARLIARRAGFSGRRVQAVSFEALQPAAVRPRYSALASERGLRLGNVDDAIDLCLEALDGQAGAQRIAV